VRVDEQLWSAAEECSSETVTVLNVSKSSGPLIAEPHMCDTGAPMSVCRSVRVLHGGRFNFFRGFGGKAVSPIVGDCPIDDRSAVDAFPCVEGQEKVRESFQLHQSFALRAIHNYVLPRWRE